VRSVFDERLGVPVPLVDDALGLIVGQGMPLTAFYGKDGRLPLVSQGALAEDTLRTRIHDLFGLTAGRWSPSDGAVGPPSKRHSRHRLVAQFVAQFAGQEGLVPGRGGTISNSSKAP
jgi:hypothetical protein